MKTTVACLFFIGACLFYYNRLHPFGRPSIPDGHEYTAEGVYFLRTAYTVSAPGDPVQWKQGQQVFEDRLAKTPAPAGMRLVTDGSHSAPIPTNMLSEDVQEGQALRQVEIDAQTRAAQAQAQAQAVAKAEQDRLRAEQESLRAANEAKAEQARLLAAQARHPSPTPSFGHTALDQPTQFRPARSGYWYYGRYYYYPAPTPSP